VVALAWDANPPRLELFDPAEGRTVVTVEISAQPRLWIWLSRRLAGLRDLLGGGYRLGGRSPDAPNGPASPGCGLGILTPTESNTVLAACAYPVNVWLTDPSGLWSARTTLPRRSAGLRAEGSLVIMHDGRLC